jgi:hypothetical protein
LGCLRGAHGGATSFGWACADPDDPGDDRTGWLERQAAGRALDGIARDNDMADGGTLIARASDPLAWTLFLYGSLALTCGPLAVFLAVMARAGEDG